MVYRSASTATSARRRRPRARTSSESSGGPSTGSSVRLRGRRCSRRRRDTDCPRPCNQVRAAPWWPTCSKLSTKRGACSPRRHPCWPSMGNSGHSPGQPCSSCSATATSAMTGSSACIPGRSAWTASGAACGATSRLNQSRRRGTAGAARQDRRTPAPTSATTRSAGPTAGRLFASPALAAALWASRATVRGRRSGGRTAESRLAGGGPDQPRIRHRQRPQLGLGGGGVGEARGAGLVGAAALTWAVSAGGWRPTSEDQDVEALTQVTEQSLLWQRLVEEKGPAQLRSTSAALRREVEANPSVRPLDPQGRPQEPVRLLLLEDASPLFVGQ